MSAELEVPTVLPGLHRDVPHDEYARWPAVNHSILREFSRTPLHAREAMIRPHDQAEAQALGAAAHCAVLEPDRFDESYVVVPKLDKRTTEGKRRWAEFQGQYPSHEYLTADEHTACLRMRDAVWGHQTAAELLKAKGVNEASALWQDRDTGLMVKARPDRITSLASYPVVVDLKTARDAGRRSFEFDVWKFRYFQQAALYLDGLSTLAPSHDRKFLFVVVEKESPHAVAVYELDAEAVQLGRDDYQKHLTQYAECIRTGLWPGFDPGVGYVSVPAHAFKYGEES